MKALIFQVLKLKIKKIKSSRREIATFISLPSTSIICIYSVNMYLFCTNLSHSLFSYLINGTFSISPFSLCLFHSPLSPSPLWFLFFLSHFFCSKFNYFLNSIFLRGNIISRRHNFIKLSSYILFSFFTLLAFIWHPCSFSFSFLSLFPSY